jgi:hypothetical protein
MADIDLPVFSFRPNLREPMTERLEFLTDVLRAAEGAEQRRSLRETPRRTYDADFLLVGAERTFWDLFMSSIGGQEIMAPLYWEVVTLTNGLTAAVSDRIDFNTAYTEWPYFDGGLALVAGKTALDWEVVQIAAVDSGGIDLVDPVVKAWPRGAKLYPLRRSVVEDFGDLGHVTAAVAGVTARLRMTVANPWTPAAEPAPIYAGLPALLDEPNWVDDLSVEMSREIALLDTQIGRTYQVDALGRFFVGQAHRYFLPGRAKMAAFRDLLYRYRGRTGGFWLPTFKADFKLAAAAGSGATQLEVENVGFQYAGGPMSGREYIAIRHAGGTILRKLLDVIPGTTSATEKLVLDSATGLALAPGQARKISFMDTARFDSDQFEIVHHAGADGLHECSTVFRAFKNTRTSPAPISAPIALTGESEVPCGTPRGPVAGGPWVNRGMNYFVIGGAQEVAGTLTEYQKWFAGYIDSLRITKGVARYPVDQFIVPGTEFANDTNDPYWASVISLLRFNGTDGDTFSTNEKGTPLVFHGNAHISDDQAKFGDTSCHFDGAGDWVEDQIGAVSGALGETFTIEAWVYPTARGGGPGIGDYGAPILGYGPTSTGFNDSTFGLRGNFGYPRFLVHGSPDTTLDAELESVPLNQWSHVSACRVGTSGLYYIHVNGKLATSP